MSRKLVRHTLAEWLSAAQIPGLDHVYPGKPQEILWGAYATGGSSHLCQAYIIVSRRRETRIAGGEADVLTQRPQGQKEITSTVTIVVFFRSTDPDWLAAQDTYDDITEAMTQQLRGGGRALGRPDVIIAAGEFAAGIEQQDDEPEALDGGVMQTACGITLEVKEIINS